MNAWTAIILIAALVLVGWWYLTDGYCRLCGDDCNGWCGFGRFKDPEA